MDRQAQAWVSTVVGDWMDPKVYLCIDNCFASKRWTRPKEWLTLIRDLGLRYAEASADTECDPLYMDPGFTADWVADVKHWGAELGVAVKNIYSGHGTYVTSGLAHYDRRVSLRFRDEWVLPQMRTAKELGAGMGFFVHGFEDLLLQDHSSYTDKLHAFCADLAQIAVHARDLGLPYVGVEQMYSPHQPPWTIEGTRQLLLETNRSGAPFYIALDLGHMNGQRNFAKPEAVFLREKISQRRAGEPVRGLWLGSRKAHELFESAISDGRNAGEAVKAILHDVESNPHLFANPRDWNVMEWVRTLGRYSPIVHLQQSDGVSSSHWPFSRAYNQKGIIKAEQVLRALADSFAQEAVPGMPPACGEVALTFEPFISTAGNVYDFLDDLRESVAYWRRYVPEDGMRLSAAVEGLG